MKPAIYYARDIHAKYYHVAKFTTERAREIYMNCMKEGSIFEIWTEGKESESVIYESPKKEG